MNKEREIKEDYIIRQIQISDFPERIKILKLIIDWIGVNKVTPIADGTIVRFDEIPDDLVNELFHLLEKSEKENRIDFSDVVN
jgi:hypothetical protein